MHYVYFLFENNGQVYTGSSNSLDRRLDEHQRGKVNSTRNRRPLKHIGHEVYMLKSDALRREKFLKTTEGKRLFRQQYRDVLAELREANDLSAK